jgi:hypothetical protein
MWFYFVENNVWFGACGTSTKKKKIIVLPLLELLRANSRDFADDIDMR